MCVYQHVYAVMRHKLLNIKPLAWLVRYNSAFIIKMNKLLLHPRESLLIPGRHLFLYYAIFLSTVSVQVSSESTDESEKPSNGSSSKDEL